MMGSTSVCNYACLCGLAIASNSDFFIRMANHQKVKCLGLVQSLEIEVFEVKTFVSFHVMPARLRAFPIILGRPWPQAVGDI